MNEARRTLSCWLLLAFLEKGCGATRDLPPRQPARVRPIDEHELRRLSGPLAPIRVLATPPDPSSVIAPAPQGRLLTFPSRSA